MSEIAAATTFPRSLDEIRVANAEVPAHVPADRVVDISFAMGGVPNDLVDPYEPFAWLNGQDVPRLLFGRAGRSALASSSGSAAAGNWVVT